LPSIVLVRDRPEDLGLHPDGIDPQASPPIGTLHEGRATSGPVITPTEASWTVGEALRSATFWKLLTVPATAGLVGTGLVFHQVALLGSHGLTATWALAMMSVQAGFAMLLTIPIGWLTDRIASRHILFGGMLTLALAILLVMRMPATWVVVVYALLLGLNGSILRCTATVVWINYYGRTHQGAVRGVVWAVMILASALGPLPLALSIDRFGSYDPALYIFLSLPLIAAVAVRTAHPPRRPTDRPV
jgi:MFS family permease